MNFYHTHSNGYQAVRVSNMNSYLHFIYVYIIMKDSLSPVCHLNVSFVLNSIYGLHLNINCLYTPEDSDYIYAILYINFVY